MNDLVKWMLLILVIGGFAIFVEPIKSSIAIGLLSAEDPFEQFILNNFLVVMFFLVIYVVFNSGRRSP